jgi:phage-related protein (TIGR01555 family)
MGYEQTDSGVYVPSTDSLTNVVSGLGGARDKRTHNQFQFSLAGFQNWVELEAAYTENWIARKIVQAPVDDGLREWRTWNCEEASEIEREERRLRLKPNFRDARYWGRLYGGAGILMVTDQPLDHPLEVDKIREGSLKRLIVLDRWDISALNINYTDPTAANFLLPEYYHILGGQTRIHHSHVVRVEGEQLPRRVRAYNDGWGDSTLRRVMSDLRDTVATKEGVASLVQEANVDVVTRDGLSSELATDQGNEITQRYALGKQMQSMINMLLLDGSESYERKEVTFSGLDGILDRFMIWTAGAAEIPVTKLFGRSAAGENATGEGDLKNYYDDVASAQETEWRPELEQLDEVLVRSALGEFPEEADWQWNPLYQESGTELAQQELALAQADDMRLQHGVKESHILRRLQGRGTYAIEDEEVEAAAEAERAVLEEPTENEDLGT